jgi:hypothetical protein
VSIFATESPGVRRLGTNRWRIETGLIAKLGCQVSREILWQGFAICNLRTRRALARQNRTESSNLSSSATQSGVLRIAAFTSPEMREQCPFSAIIPQRTGLERTDCSGEIGGTVPSFLRRADAQSVSKEGIRRMPCDHKPGDVGTLNLARQRTAVGRPRARA